MTSDREAERVAFLASAGLSDASRQPLPGDASTRRYERLSTADGTRLMFMDQMASAESPRCAGDWDEAARLDAGWNATARLAAGRVDVFADIAAWLRGAGLSAPEVLALDAERGFAVLEDFGDASFAREIAAGADEEAFYLAAVDAVVAIQTAPPPPGLLTYDALVLRAGADLFLDWWPRLRPRVAFDDAARADWARLWAPIVARGVAGANSVAHRDYHAENLIWLADREGAARVGLIDFQDALVAHPSWDLHSLLQDARRDVPPDLEARALNHYFRRRPEIDRDDFMADYAGLAAINQVRILGIFARLIVRDGKPRYNDFIPRLWRQLARNLDRPELSSLRGWFDANVPVEARS